MSLVRSNSEGEIGFLADVRRMNVALTRARRKLLVVGDSATLSVLPFYQRLFEYFESSAATGRCGTNQVNDGQQLGSASQRETCRPRGG